jgi:hypothetical protein
MTAIHETTYPRIHSDMSGKELEERYTQTPDDLAFMQRATKSMVTSVASRRFKSTFAPVPRERAPWPPSDAHRRTHLAQGGSTLGSAPDQGLGQRSAVTVGAGRAPQAGLW